MVTFQSSKDLLATTIKFVLFLGFNKSTVFGILTFHILGDDGLETDAVDPEIVVAEQKSQLPIRGEKIDNYHKLCRGEKVKIRGFEKS